MYKQIGKRIKTNITTGMWLVPFFLLSTLLMFKPINQVLAQNEIILWDVQGRSVGKATISQHGDNDLMLSLAIADMLPVPGDRRVVVSEVGQCDLPDFASAGEDVYELPMIQFYASGKANYERVVTGIDLNSFADEDGSALIVYADSDEKVTERILCGIIAGPSGSSHESGAASHETPHWGYEGENGPDRWGELDSDYALCGTGQSQSPIDITNPSEKNLVDIAFNYYPTTLNHIVNNGHSVQVNYDAGSTIQVDGITYELKQFHFHAPSEHTINGQYFELEMHLVHQSADGKLAVVGVLIGSGAEHTAFNSVWDNLPTNVNEERSSEATLNAKDLLPTSGLSYRYSGSLTTPPCSEGVKWLVLTTPIEMSDAQIASFKNIMNNNNRPIQPSNGREIMIDSSVD